MVRDDGSDISGTAAAERWAAAGLDGRPPHGLVDHVDDLARRIEAAARSMGTPISVDGLGCVTERRRVQMRSPNAARRAEHLDRTISVGGACHLLRTADGWIAVSLPRRSDVELVPAWLHLDAVGADPWATVAAAVAHRPGAEVVAHARELGMAATRVGERPSEGAVIVTRREPAPVRARPLVVDLSSMWAGPLCGAIAAAAGCRVLKVESTGRPDGAREGHPELFASWNAGKVPVALDLTSAEGRATLVAFIDAADVIIEASRPRALVQMGIERERWPGRVWVSITGYGRPRSWAAFGDDAAAAGGLVEWADGTPAFVGDAIADPLTGLSAAAAMLETLAAGESAFVDVSMSSVAALAAGR